MATTNKKDREQIAWNQKHEVDFICQTWKNGFFFITTTELRRIAELGGKGKLIRDRKTLYACLRVAGFEQVKRRAKAN